MGLCLHWQQGRRGDSQGTKMPGRILPGRGSSRNRAISPEPSSSLVLRLFDRRASLCRVPHVAIVQPQPGVRCVLVVGVSFGRLPRRFGRTDSLFIRLFHALTFADRLLLKNLDFSPDSFSAKWLRLAIPPILLSSSNTPHSRPRSPHKYTPAIHRNVTAQLHHALAQQRRP